MGAMRSRKPRSRTRSAQIHSQYTQDLPAPFRVLTQYLTHQTPRMRTKSTTHSLQEPRLVLALCLVYFADLLVQEGIERMLHLIGSKENTTSVGEDGKELKGIRPYLIECYRSLSFDSAP